MILLTAVAGVVIWSLTASEAYRSWEEIKASGVLRVASSHSIEQTGLQQSLNLGQKELAMIERFALNHGLRMELVTCDDEKIPSALSHNRADIGVSGIQQSQTDTRKLLFSPTVLETVCLMPSEAINLQKHLNDFLETHSAKFLSDICTDDLPAIAEKRILRVLTVNTPPLYYIEQDHFNGFEYDLVKNFAESQNLKVVVITVPDRRQMEQWLKEGRGDLASAAIPAEPKVIGLASSESYAEARNVLAFRKDTEPLPRSLDEIEPQRILLPDFMVEPEELKDHPNLIEAGVEAFEVLDLVENREADFAIVDNLLARAKMHTNDDITYSLIIGAPKKYVWLIRSGNPELKAAADNYISKLLSSDFYRVVFSKYFSPKIPDLPGLKSQYKLKVHNDELSFSPFDHLIKKHARHHEFDWLLVVAQIYQESRFIAEIIATDGGIGLMQLMPFTAKEMNCSQPLDPEQNIKAGIGYLAKQYQRLDKEIAPRERLCFALAAYNGGYGHLIDARKIAKQQGWDPNIWSKNVERAFKLLERKEFYAKSNYGACRSDIIIRYVNEIIERYDRYREIPKER